MASQQKIDANRRNARKSTGPKTPEGKAASRNNAFKHGMRSRRIVLPCEDQAEYDHLHQRLCERFEPLSEVEEFLVKQIADAQWRLERLKGIETALFDLDEVDFDELERIAKWQTRMENSYYRALKQLELLKPAAPEPSNSDRKNNSPQPKTPYVLKWLDDDGNFVPAPGFDENGPLPPERRDRG